MKTLLLCVVVVFVFTLLAVIPASAASILAEEDTYTYAGSTGTNYNNQGLLIKRQTGLHRYSWIEFVLGSDPVVSASMNMFLYSIPTNWGTWHTTGFKAAEYDMDESTLTWNTHPDVSAWTDIAGWTA